MAQENQIRVVTYTLYNLVTVHVLRSASILRSFSAKPIYLNRPENTSLSEDMLRTLTTPRFSSLLRGQFTLPRPGFTIPRHLPQVDLASPHATRAFSNSQILYKKKDKAKKGAATEQSDNDQSLKNSNGGAVSDDPSDLSPLQNDIAASVSRFKDDLSKLRAGGRLNTEVIEDFRVHLIKGSKESVKLGELAQVVPKGGRMVTVLAAEEDVS